MASRWFPSSDQLSSPESLQRAFQQLLTKHYALQDHVEKLVNATTQGTTQGATQATDTPAGTKFLGLHVAPVDTQTLGDGAMLKFDKKAGNFKFTL